METTVKTYRGEKEYEKDVPKMANHGWRVQTSTSRDPRSGCMRVIMLGGIGALIFKPKPIITVTYVRGAIATM